jgi:hypothetical protein
MPKCLRMHLTKRMIISAKTKKEIRKFICSSLGKWERPGIFVLGFCVRGGNEGRSRGRWFGEVVEFKDKGGISEAAG